MACVVGRHRKHDLHTVACFRHDLPESGQSSVARTNEQNESRRAHLSWLRGWLGSLWFRSHSTFRRGWRGFLASRRGWRCFLGRFKLSFVFLFAETPFYFLLRLLLIFGVVFLAGRHWRVFLHGRDREWPCPRQIFHLDQDQCQARFEGRQGSTHELRNVELVHRKRFDVELRVPPLHRVANRALDLVGASSCWQVISTVCSRTCRPLSAPGACVCFRTTK